MDSERGCGELQLLLNLGGGKRLERLQDFAGRRIDGCYCHAILSLRSVSTFPIVTAWTSDPPFDSGFVVGPQYYLTGRPRQRYTFKSPDLLDFQIEAGREMCGQKFFHPL